MKRFGRARGILAVGAAAAVAAGITVAAGTVASAQTGAADIDPEAYYQLVSRHSGKAVQVADAATADGAEVVQWEPHDGHHQQFQFVSSGDGYYRIMARHSGKVLDVFEWNSDNGAEIRQWPDLDGSNQQFEVLDTADGYVTFINQFSGRALDVWEWSTEDGARIAQWDAHGGANQEFTLVPVAGDGNGNGDGGGDGGGSCDGEVGDGAPVDPLPVAGSTWAHDPDMIRTPSGYVVFATHNGVETRTSPDRVNFTRTEQAIPGGATWAGQYNGGDPNFIWAPDVSLHNGTYWLYYSVSTFGSNTSAIGLATSDTGQPGSFVDQGMVYDSGPGDNYNAIDPSLLVDADGQWWLVFGSFWSGIQMIALDPSTGMQSATDQTRYSLASTPSTEIEGPTIVYRCGFYYLFVSFGRCCQGLDSTYRIMVGRAEQPTGPYLDRAGVDMRDGGGTEVLATHGNVVGPGAGSVLADDDGDLLVYHYYDGAANGAVRLGLNHLTWEGGWPAVASG